jgi:HAMP domain-containing protein
MGIMILVFGVHIYLDIRITSDNLIHSVNDSADRAGELIARSTRYSMLLNRKDDVRETIQTLGNQPGFLGISIYNKTGETVFSTDSAAVGHKVDFYAEACVICHSAELPLSSVPSTGRMRVYESPGHERVLGVIHPIENEPACYNADCHVHGADETILGVLDVKMSLAAVDQRVAQARNAMISSSLLLALLISTVFGLFIYNVVQKPIQALMRGMKTISSGDLTTRLDCESTSEIGDLSRSFNKMADDLGEARKEVGEWARTLEDRINRKSEELEQVHEQMIHMEKMA